MARLIICPLEITNYMLTNKLCFVQSDSRRFRCRAVPRFPPWSWRWMSKKSYPPFHCLYQYLHANILLLLLGNHRNVFHVQSVNVITRTNTWTPCHTKHFIGPLKKRPLHRKTSKQHYSFLFVEEYKHKSTVSSLWCQFRLHITTVTWTTWMPSLEDRMQRKSFSQLAILASWSYSPIYLPKSHFS